MVALTPLAGRINPYLAMPGGAAGRGRGSRLKCLPDTCMINGGVMIFGGWLWPLMVWLLAGSANSRLATIVIITYLVGLGKMSQIFN